MTKPSGPDLRIDRAHSARVYDYLLGGKDNYAADRAAADAVVAANPSTPIAARANRAFMHRVAATMADHGLDQFLDIGTGIPTEPNLHQIVQAVRPASHVVYVDHDPVVLAHAAARMAGDSRGRTEYIHADMRDPAKILAAPALRAAIDLDRPVGLSLIAVLHFVVDVDEVDSLVTTLVDALAPGSLVAMSHFTGDLDPERTALSSAQYRASAVPIEMRSMPEIERLFLGLELLHPGVVPVHRWRPEADLPVVEDRDVPVAGGLARKG